jgi:4-amino-4-deoxy-L-arabinose transferase-like glycosyltransferase
MTAPGDRPRADVALVLGALVPGMLAAHAAFSLQDTGTPVWDEALHLLLAARLRDLLAAPSRETFDALREAWSFYPPLYHAAVGTLFHAMGLSPLAPRLVNVMLLAVLGWGTFRAGAALFGRGTALAAAALVVTFPIVTRLARMAMTDLGLAAWTAASVGCLLATGLQRRRHVVLLGVLLAAGLLTKWTFPAFVAGPLAVWALAHGRGAVETGRLRRLALAALVAVAAAGPWYAANAGTIVERGRYLAGLGPAQGNPYGWTWANVVAYPQIVSAAFVTAPVRWVLAGAVVLALVRLVRRRAAPAGESGMGASAGLVLIASWLLVPYVAMTAISNKDPRFVLPVVAPLAVLGGWALMGVPRRPRTAALAVVFGHLALLHGLSALPGEHRERVLSWLAGVPVLERSVRHDVARLARPPDPGWPAGEIVEVIHGGLTPVAPYASLEVVPDLSTVNPNSLTWLARRMGYRLEARHPRDVAEIEPLGWEYVLVKPEGDQGASHTTASSADVTRRILAAPAAFRVSAELAGPGGERLLLLRTPGSVPPPDLRADVIDLASPSSRWHLGPGWGALEPAGRWALGRRAVVRVERPAGRASTMSVELAPYPELPRSQVVTVRYRGAVLAAWRPAGPAGGVFEVEVPAALPTGGIDELTLEFAVSARPSELGVSGDPRDLAVFVREVRFR